MSNKGNGILRLLITQKCCYTVFSVFSVIFSLTVSLLLVTGRKCKTLYGLIIIIRPVLILVRTHLHNILSISEIRCVSTINSWLPYR